MNRRDVVVIGGSLAGAACVRELVRLGIDAVAFERDRFPRAKVCGGFLSPGAVSCLEEIDVLNEVRAAGAVEVTCARVRAGGREVEIPFRRPGLGISRAALDAIVAEASHVEQGRLVSRVVPAGDGFVVDDVPCAAVIDAAGKLSRFTRRRRVDEFGVQYTTPAARGSTLDFWFFEDGYGGGVSIEGGRSNFCFLINKEAVRRHIPPEGGLVTGPLAYDKLPGDYIAIGDAAGMVDPFCGEGMRHALESGLLAARVVARGLRRRARYEDVKREYESEWERRWASRRALGEGVRRLLGYPRIFSLGLRRIPSWILAPR